MRNLGALLCILAIALSAQAQPRGMRMSARSSGPFARSAPAPQRVAVFPNPGASRTGVRGAMVPGFRRHGGPVFVSMRPHHPFGPFFARRGFVPRRFGLCRSHFCRGAFFNGVFVSSFDSFGGYPYSYSYGLADTNYVATAPYDNEAISQLANELAEERLRREQLENEVERLRAPPPLNTQPSAEQPSPAVLVFRDGTRKEVDNYAIFGPTLIAFVSHGTQKIRIADLNVAATEKANESRGIDFRLPGAGQLQTYP
jgi:hypothetical protein